MKREFLKELGLEDGVIDTIMSEHGKTVSESKLKLESTKDQLKVLSDDLNKANETIDSLKKSNEDNEVLRKQIEDYQSQVDSLNSQRLADRKQAYIDLVIERSGVRNAKAITALLDLEKIEEKDNVFSGLESQIDSLRESDGYLFNVKEQEQAPQQTSKPSIMTGGNPNVSNQAESDPFQDIINNYK